MFLSVLRVNQRGTTFQQKQIIIDSKRWKKVRKKRVNIYPENYGYFGGFPEEWPPTKEEAKPQRISLFDFKRRIFVPPCQ